MSLPNVPDLHAKAQREQVGFLQADLALCSTFCDLANTELQIMGDREAATSAQGKAEKGHATITRLLVHIDDSRQRDSLQTGLDDLRVKLDILQQCFDSSAQL